MAFEFDPVRAIAGAKHTKLTKTGWVRDRYGKDGKLVRESVRNAAHPKRWRKDIYGVPKGSLYRQIFNDPALTVKGVYRRHSHSAVGNLSKGGNVKKGFTDRAVTFDRAQRPLRIPKGIMRKALRGDLSAKQAQKYFKNYSK